MCHAWDCVCSECQQKRLDDLKRCGQVPKFDLGDLVQVRYMKRAGSKLVNRINALILKRKRDWRQSPFNYRLSNALVMNEVDLILYTGTKKELEGVGQNKANR